MKILLVRAKAQHFQITKKHFTWYLSPLTAPGAASLVIASPLYHL